MRKTLFGITVLALLAPVAIYAATSAEAPEAITIDDCVIKKAAVEFPHRAHYERDGVACADCHHTQDGLTADSGMEVKPCSDCHLEPEEETTPICSQMSLKKNPFHINCVACHKESGAEAAPTKCEGCHPKAE